MIKGDLLVPLRHGRSSSGKVVANRHPVLPSGEGFFHLRRRAADQQEFRFLDETVAVTVAVAVVVTAAGAATAAAAATTILPVLV